MLGWIDGLFVRDVSDEITGSSFTDNMFHINWGWRGLSDGYYDQGVFDSSQRIERDTTIDVNTGTNPGVYTWDFRTVTYESKN